jgi:hypothetical protein
MAIVKYGAGILVGRQSGRESMCVSIKYVTYFISIKGRILSAGQVLSKKIVPANVKI